MNFSGRRAKISITTWTSPPTPMASVPNHNKYNVFDIALQSEQNDTLKNKENPQS
jgi:hypothetical protein